MPFCRVSVAPEVTSPLMSSSSSLSLPPDNVTAPVVLIAPPANNVAAAVLSSSSAVTRTTPAPPASSVIDEVVTFPVELTVRFAAAESVTAATLTSPPVDVKIFVPAPERLMVPMLESAATPRPVMSTLAARSTLPLVIPTAPPATTSASKSSNSSLSVPPAKLAEPSTVIAPAASKVDRPVLSVSAVTLRLPEPPSSSVTVARVTPPVARTIIVAFALSVTSASAMSPAVPVTRLAPGPERLTAVTALVAVTLAPVKATPAARSAPFVF